MYEFDIDFYGSGWMKIEVVGVMKKKFKQESKKGKRVGIWCDVCNFRIGCCG